MDSTKILGLLESLDDEIDDLEESLAPLLKVALSDTASKLPLLDKAKLYVLVTYAIESILFSHLRLNGVKAREHPVFVELTRVKQYFDKIKQAEFGPAERNMVVDKGAAARFIKAGLAGNTKYDLERAEREAKERFMKAKAHTRFEETANSVQKRKADEEPKDGGDSPDSTSESDSDSGSPENLAPAQPKKRQKPDHIDSAPGSGSSTPKKSKDSKQERKEKKKEKRGKKRARKEKKQKQTQT